MIVTTQKTISIADGTVKLYAMDTTDEHGNIEVITPLKTLELLRESMPLLIKLVNTQLAPNVSFDYYLPDDHNEAYAIYEIYSEKQISYDTAFKGNLDKIVSTLRSFNSKFFSPWLISVSPNLTDISQRIYECAAKLAGEYLAAKDEVIKQANNLSYEMERTREGQVMIVAPTLSAVLSNEVTVARFNAKVSGYTRRVLEVYAFFINIVIAFQKSINSELSEIMQEGLQEVEDSFVRGMTDISGNAAQKAWWKNLKEHPLDVESYITILENESDVCGLHEIAKYFEIDDVSLKEACLNKLRHTLGSNAISATTFKNDTFFTNVCTYLGMSGSELTFAVYSGIINSTKDKLCSCSKQIPGNAIADIRKNATPHDAAQECIQAIISQNDFIALCEIAKEQLIHPLTEAFSIGKRSSSKDVYAGMISHIEERLVKAKKILADTNAQIDELNRKKADYENERKNAGFFAFSKKKAAAAKISEVENQIKAVESTCQQKLSEL